jgi:hypothetical protein
MMPMEYAMNAAMVYCCGAAASSQRNHRKDGKEEQGNEDCKLDELSKKRHGKQNENRYGNDLLHSRTRTKRIDQISD